MSFKKAVKSQAKLRCALFGPSGAGKTYTALAIASGMGQKIALIDSEHSSASKYADRFQFDTVDLKEKSITEYIEKINEAAVAGYDVLVIDSLTHGWQELLEEVDKLAKTRFKGNSWAAWQEGTPKQRLLIEAILNYPGHVMATMRSKTEWQTETTDGGKTKPTRVGLAPEQGKGIEYEFDLLLEMSVDHFGSVLKDRTGKYQDKILEKPGKKFGEELVAWLSEGVALAPIHADKTAEDIVKAFPTEVKQLMKAAGYDNLDKAVQLYKFLAGDVDALKQLCEEKIKTKETVVTNA